MATAGTSSSSDTESSEDLDSSEYSYDAGDLDTPGTEDKSSKHTSFTELLQFNSYWMRFSIWNDAKNWWPYYLHMLLIWPKVCLLEILYLYGYNWMNVLLDIFFLLPNIWSMF